MVRSIACEPDRPAKARSVDREVLASELESRIFGEAFDDRPSDTRLVQIYMSKQVPAETMLPAHLLGRSRTLYLALLRKATHILGQGQPAAAVAGGAAKPQGLLRSSCVTNSMANSSSAAATANADGDFVMLEANRWAALCPSVISKYIQTNGLLHEFRLISALQTDFPLHYIVFQQCASHIAHEGNSESTFSSAGGLTDPNIAANFLARLTRVAGRKHMCKPTWEAVYIE